LSNPKVVVAGLGDSGLLTAINLASHFDVVGIGTKPGMVSSQELGIRLARPDDWEKQYRVPFEHFRKFDRVRTVHGTVTGVDLDRRLLSYKDIDGSTGEVVYDVLVIATGVTNGFWRRPDVQTADEIDKTLRTTHETLADGSSIAIIGGGAASVGSAANLAAAWPDKKIDLYFPGEAALPHHHRGVWGAVRKVLLDRGVGLHPGHRAVIPAGFDCDEITHEPVEWSTGQPPTIADAVVWAVGKVRPNSDWLPAELLNDDGFVRVNADLQLPERPEIFAIGDIAATDPLRTSARNRADKILGRNIRAHLKGRPLKAYKPPRRRWGSIIGNQPNGLTVYAPNGKGFRFPNWSIDTVLQPLIVRRGIYRGIRRPPSKEKS
jgi:NADH dehydrogenase FAD-containing subunit